MKKIVSIARQIFGKQSKHTGIGILQILEEYPDQKGSEMWQRLVKTIIEIIYSNPESFFDKPRNFSKRLKGSFETTYGIIAKIETTQFASKTSFIGFAGNKETGRYAITVTLLEDRDRPKPVFIYTFKVSLGSKNQLCKIVAVFQDKRQHDETMSYKNAVEADLVYHGDMAMGLARVFHELTLYPMPIEIASVLGVVGFSDTYQYRC